MDLLARVGHQSPMLSQSNKSIVNDTSKAPCTPAPIALVHQSLNRRVYKSNIEIGKTLDCNSVASILESAPRHTCQYLWSSSKTFVPVCLDISRFVASLPDTISSKS
jgi:hypothetical protein